MHASITSQFLIQLLIACIHKEGFSEKRGSRYFIGTALAQLGTQALSSNSISELSRPILADLAQRTGETTHLAIPSGPHSLILEVCDSPNPVPVSSRANTLAEMHCSSTGKIFLAFLANGDDIVDQLTLQKCTDRTHTSVAALRGDLEVVRELGYAVDDEEYVEDVRCLAAPIRDSSGKVIAAMGITGTASRFTKERNSEIAAVVIAAGKRLETSLQTQ